MILPESTNVLISVVKVFKRLQIQYFVGGSMASAFYGVTRSTLDADIVAEINFDQVARLKAVPECGGGMRAGTIFIPN